MKIRFKFWELDEFIYNKKRGMIYPYVYPPYKEIPGIAFIDIGFPYKNSPGIKPYILKRVGR